MLRLFRVNRTHFGQSRAHLASLSAAHERSSYTYEPWVAAAAVAAALVASEARSDGESGDAARWQAVLDKTIPSVVSIKVNATRSFDTNGPGASQATGFVVDAKQGLVLTNRHVVQTGPVLAEALFQNHEEVPLRAVYRDPVHDFGVFQFDPAKLRHLGSNGSLASLELRPDLAKVGLDIRVMGNNAGEKLSILGGTLARLDREAPNYGRNSFNDHNTFYFQAASNTSGGSSGSPVINSDGKVVALNAAGMVGTASSYYLPLERVKRAVDLIRRGEPVSRGTLQATFSHRAFNDLGRLGLPPAVEANVRDAHPGGVGMLAVSSLVPGGPGELAGLQPGDILVKIQGRLVTLFTELEEILDDEVGKPLSLEVIRGGQAVSVECRKVQDLHSITPSGFFEMGESIFHDLSYHMARNHATPVEGQGVYVCQAGYMLHRAGIAAGSLIQSVAGQPTPNLAALQAALLSCEDGALVPVRVRHVSNRAQSAVTMLRVDRTWFPAQRVDRLEVAVKWGHEKNSSDWSVTPMPPPREPTRGQERPESAEKVQTRFAPGSSKAEKALAQSLVQVSFDMPYLIDGAPGAHYTGTGVVVDAQLGLVVVDRNTVPASLGDVYLSFGSSLEVPGTVVAIHPLHNLAVVRYDPRSIGDTPVKAAVLAPPRIQQAKEASSTALADLEAEFEAKGAGGGEESRAGKEKAPKVYVKNTPPVAGKGPKEAKYVVVGLSGSARTGTHLTSSAAAPLNKVPQGQPTGLSHPPRFMDSNLEAMNLKGASANTDGVMVDEAGRVAGLWGSFSLQVNSGGRLQNVQAFQGLSADLLRELVGPLQRGEEPKFHTIGAELEFIGLAQARGMGLEEGAVRSVEAGFAKRGEWPPRLLAVKRRWGGYPAHDLLKDGDVILGLPQLQEGGQEGGQKGGGQEGVSRAEAPAAPSLFRDVERACALAGEAGERVRLEVLRDGRRLQVEVPTKPLGSDETTKVLVWGGAVLQRAPEAVARQRGLLGEQGGAYVAAHYRGSPANKYGLNATTRIVEVDGVPTPTLEAFAAAVRGKRHGEDVRLRTQDLRGVEAVSALKLDLNYWPTYEMQRLKQHQKASGASGFSTGGGLFEVRGAGDNRATWRRTLIQPSTNLEA